MRAFLTCTSPECDSICGAEIDALLLYIPFCPSMQLTSNKYLNGCINEYIISVSLTEAKVAQLKTKWEILITASCNHS